jgi:outer membrane lipopolysaccharide assembly protein LptE/RlpB
MTRRSGLAAILALLVVVAGGCGYSLRPSLPGNIKTVHIPTLLNRTQEPGIEDFVTQALTTALVTSGVARIARDAEQADAVLDGAIIEYTLTALAFDRTANVTQYRLQISLALTLKDRRSGDVVWKQDRIGDRADFQVAGQVSTTIAREQDAVRRAATDISRAIVSLAFEGF